MPTEVTMNPGSSVPRAIEIDWDRTTTGYACFLGPKEDRKKLAVLGSRHDQGLHKNGQLIMEPMARETWGLHFTSASVNVEVLKAILATLPTEA